MGFGKWALFGGAALLLIKKLSEDNDSNYIYKSDSYSYDDTETEEQKFIREEQEYLIRHNRIRSPREERKRMPCLFCDGISREEFENLARLAAKRISRISDVSVIGSFVTCTVQSQTGLSSWKFSVDYNDWGHITGTRWISNENYDSNIATHYGNILTGAISELLNERGVSVKSLSDVVDADKCLGTDKAFNNSMKTRKIKRLFGKTKTISIDINAVTLQGEHLYPVTSIIRRNNFVNYRCIPIKDVGLKNQHYINQVEDITINNISSFKIGDNFPIDSEVVITYHDKLELKAPFTSKTFRKRKYKEAVQELNSWGFENIHYREIKDIKRKTSKKMDTVESVKISGKDFNKKSIYKFDERVVIQYHTLKE